MLFFFNKKRERLQNSPLSFFYLMILCYKKFILQAQRVQEQALQEQAQRVQQEQQLQEQEQRPQEQEQRPQEQEQELLVQLAELQALPLLFSCTHLMSNIRRLGLPRVQSRVFSFRYTSH
jgi:sensor domain CHASE-containing protein